MYYTSDRCYNMSLEENNCRKLQPYDGNSCPNWKRLYNDKIVMTLVNKIGVHKNISKMYNIETKNKSRSGKNLYLRHFPWSKTRCEKDTFSEKFLTQLLLFVDFFLTNGFFPHYGLKIVDFLLFYFRTFWREIY